MSSGSVFLLVISACCTTLFLILLSLRKDLKNTRKELEEAQIEIIRKDHELEVIKSVEKELKASRGKKAPQKVDAPAAGDSTAHINRLNGVSDSADK